MANSNDFDYVRKLDGADAFDCTIMNLLGTVGGCKVASEALDRDAAKVDADPFLNDKGKADRKQALYPKHVENDDIRRFEGYVNRGQKEMARLFDELTMRPFVKPKSSDQAEAMAELIRRELHHHRMLLDYRERKPEEQIAKRLDAISKCATSETARQVVFGLRDDGLLSDAEWSRAEAQLMKGGDPVKFKRYCELRGQIRFDGSFDEATGLVAQAKFALHRLKAHAQAVTAAPQSAAFLADQRNLPAPAIAGGAMVLTRAAATDVAVYRAAQQECEEKGLRLEIEPFEQEATGN